MRPAQMQQLRGRDFQSHLRRPPTFIVNAARYWLAVDCEQSEQRAVPFHYRSGDDIRYDTRCYFNVRSKADISQLNLPHDTQI